VKPAARLVDVKNPSATIIVYDNPKALSPNETQFNAGFADGHVESMLKTTLDQRLQAQQAPR
jgi:prepilin-type processing-associated H-X9-DG protein